MRYFPLLLIFFSLLTGCNSEEQPKPEPPEPMYFPVPNDPAWETKSFDELEWNEAAADDLKEYLIEANTKSFMILVNGRIVMEEYFAGHTPTTTWKWNSAGKTLVATTTGIAQQEGLLSIHNPVYDYLGEGWTSMTADKEALITTRHLLTMTSGLDDDSDLVIKANLTYLADAGTRWSYSNVFQLLMDEVAAASGQEFSAYFDSRLKNKIGMDGFWDEGILFTIYNSNTRSMARFGILALNKGAWNGEQIINEAFFAESTTTSQGINPSYGYLWWLNGKSTYMVPGEQTVFDGPLVPNAPADMFAAMGAADQRIYVVPSKNMVIVRMGEASDPDNPSFAVSGFDNKLWAKINAVINVP
ncbi:MAG TPA: serine hydrolase [Cyclobacteriaceae bacterium]|nr:beta-lactamase family protein [Cyclobacteriaceae bacterium]HMV08213.1 serine hydrolase [Cyclobacteriaceae bacterium]HMV89085.1 serine hydrolase [Cyclobacteriaceae bacterium]HMX02056.1 serine hydrolase [Cyclobacteriaceae bacterium]HMX49968.1 serine hydrolase [Cyclobacteriaceae bacterium]